jgi:hypothetical protein
LWLNGRLRVCARSLWGIAAFYFLGFVLYILEAFFVCDVGIFGLVDRLFPALVVLFGLGLDDSAQAVGKRCSSLVTDLYFGSIVFVGLDMRNLTSK